MDKHSCRAELLKRLRDADAAELARIDELVIKRFLALPEYAAARTVFCYISFGRELNSRRLLQRILDDGKQLSTPLITGPGLMEARRVEDLNRLLPGEFGILAPPQSAPLTAPRDIDLLIIPGLGFDSQRWRLGRGGGYYDRFLAACPGLSVGLTRELQMLDAAPHDSWDRRVRILLTESRIFR